MKKLFVGGAAAAALVLSTAANADSIHIDWTGGSLVLHSGDMAGALDEPGPRWRGGNLRDVHEALHSDGVGTDGLVTFLLAETDSGLAFMALVDDNSIGGPSEKDSWLGFETSAPTDAEFFINGLNDLEGHSESGGVETAFGEFNWASETKGDALAWAGLSEGDDLDMAFSQSGPAGLAPGDAFQFVTYGENGWQVVATGAFEEGSFAFSGTIVPLPAALAMGIAGLAGVVVTRRRRAATA